MSFQVALGKNTAVCFKSED